MSIRHSNLLQFICIELKEKGRAPTRAEIAARFDWWPNAVTEALNSLVRSGVIRIIPRKTRGIEVIAP